MGAVQQQRRGQWGTEGETGFRIQSWLDVRVKWKVPVSYLRGGGSGGVWVLASVGRFGLKVKTLDSLAT